jgi:hypothetical protein
VQRGDAYSSPQFLIGENMRMSECHPDKIYFCKGLCRTCYNHKWRIEHKEHRRNYDREYGYKNRERIKKQDNDRELLKKYGMTRVQWTALFEKQGKVCAICKSDNPKGRGVWHNDHDHSSGLFRGILCHNCNIGIGNLQDSITVLENAIRYLSRS